MTAAALAGGLAAVGLVWAAGEAWPEAVPRRGAAGSGRPAGRLLGLLARLGRRLGVAPAPEALGRRLAAAGAPSAISPADVMAAKTAAGLLGLLVGLGAAPALPGRLGAAAALAAPALAAVAPELLLRRRATRRARRMRAEAADVLDLLRVCVQAGRTPAAALAEVGRRHRGMLGGELRRAAREVALGRPRDEVAGLLADRCPLEEIAALAAALRRADRHGAPLAPALESLAADARAARARAVRERAARAAPKIQLVVALLLVPAVMLLVGAALAAAFGAT